MAQPRRKYDPRRRAAQLAKSFAKNYAIVWAGTLVANVINLKTGKTVQLSRANVGLITDIKHHWTVYACVMGRGIDNREFITSEQMSFYSKDQNEKTHVIECLSTDIADLVTEQCNNLYNRCNKNLSVNIGWVATPSLTNLTDEQLASYMTELGAWDFLAKWETTIK